MFIYYKTKNKNFIFNLFVLEKIAFNLYKKNGFVIVGDGNTEDEYYMKLGDYNVYEKFKAVSKGI